MFIASSSFIFSRLEASKDDYRIRCEELEKEITELRQQNEDLTTLADEAQSLKDEMDVLRCVRGLSAALTFRLVKLQIICGVNS